MTSQELHILQHALGLDQFGQGTSYRRHFVAGAGSVDHATCVALRERGLMAQRAGNAITGGDDCFLVTDAGRAAVASESPRPPKLTRSQRRYRAFLDEDSGLSFKEWLKSGADTPRDTGPQACWSCSGTGEGWTEHGSCRSCYGSGIQGHVPPYSREARERAMAEGL